MPEKSQSKTPLLDGVLSKLPKEFLPIWDMYSKNFDPDQAIEKHTVLVARFHDLQTATDHCINNVLHHLSLHVQPDVELNALNTYWIISRKIDLCDRALRVMLFPQTLKTYGERLGVLREKLSSLEAEKKSAGDDASKELGQEIVRICGKVLDYEKSAEECCNSLHRQRTVLAGRQVKEEQ
ncbi:MAG: hypothetical protein Q9221_007499 [Calogaya cf. arnoldii]